jgi:hypothetical protein
MSSGDRPDEVATSVHEQDAMPSPLGEDHREPHGSVQPHGHALVERLLPDIAERVRHGYLIEVGTTREKLPGQGSTVILAALAARLGLPFVTVDMDPANTEQARLDMAEFPKASAVTAKGEDFLKSFDEPVLAAYLDAFDIQHGKHSPYRIERYRRFLGVEITNRRASAMHLACVEALLPTIVPGGLIVIDDTWPEGNRFEGKGRTAVPALLDSGFSIAGRTNTAIALQQSMHPLPAILRRPARIFRWTGRQVRALLRFGRRVVRALARRVRG